MKKYSILLIPIFSIILLGCSTQEERDVNSFSFAFITDVHLQTEQNAVEGFLQAIDTLNKLQPEFVITGGDLIMDALAVSHGFADSAYQLYIETSKAINAPVHNSMGNHDIYGIYEASNADKNHPDYGEKMFENNYGKSYYSFNHNGWKFMVLNSIEDTHKGKYIGLIDDPQIEWIKKELMETDAATPIVLTTHIPFITIHRQRHSYSTRANDSTLVVYNSKDVLDMFNDHNLKLVLQGHLHIVEDLYIDGVRYLTGGAICGSWWDGSYFGIEEGFMMIHIKGDDFAWEYIDYGWEVEY